MRAKEMPVLMETVESQKAGFPRVPTGPWKSRTDREISTFPRLRRERGKVEKPKAGFPLSSLRLYVFNKQRPSLWSGQNTTRIPGAPHVRGLHSYLTQPGPVRVTSLNDLTGIVASYMAAFSNATMRYTGLAGAWPTNERGVQRDFKPSVGRCTRVPIFELVTHLGSSVVGQRPQPFDFACRRGSIWGRGYAKFVAGANYICLPSAGARLDLLSAGRYGKEQEWPQDHGFSSSRHGKPPRPEKSFRFAEEVLKKRGRALEQWLKCAQARIPDTIRCLFRDKISSGAL